MDIGVISQSISSFIAFSGTILTDSAHKIYLFCHILKLLLKIFIFFIRWLKVSHFQTVQDLKFSPSVAADCVFW